jgi:hypothetical protein
MGSEMSGLPVVSIWRWTVGRKVEEKPGTSSYGGGSLRMEGAELSRRESSTSPG